LTLHSKIAGPSKCSYRLKCSRRSWFHIPLVVSYPVCGAHKHYTWPKSGFLALNYFRLISAK
jgi:hypothetical protein